MKRKLTETIIKKFETPAEVEKKFDGGGMYLELKKTGQKTFRYKFYFQGEEKNITLGVYPETSLETAREKHLHYRKQLKEGHNPLVLKAINKHEDAEAYNNTFQKLAERWMHYNRHLKSKKQWNDAYLTTVKNRLERNVFPKFGNIPIKSVKATMLWANLEEIKGRGLHETAKRVNGYCSLIFAYAISIGKSDSNPAMEIKSLVQTEPKTHFHAMTLELLPEFLVKLEKNEARLYPQTVLGLKLIVLCLTRKNELCKAKWEEFDFEKKLWTIPGRRMKMKKEHLVPLSSQMIDILQNLKKMNGNYEYVFIGQNSVNKPMNGDTLLRAMYRMGYQGIATVHGFRALAMTTIQEELGYDKKYPDRQLAHSNGDPNGEAYDKAKFLPERIVMMQEWSDFIDRQLEIGLSKTAKEQSVTTSINESFRPPENMQAVLNTFIGQL